MKTKIVTKLSIASAVLSLLTTSATAVDLLEHYPTQLTVGDAKPDHARPWQFNEADVFRVSRFELKIGDKFKVETGSADLGIGHCADGAVWAVLIPREQGTLTSPATGAGETIANVWLRFHPAEINRLFPPDTVFADGNRDLTAQIRAIAEAKMTSSWQSDGKAMIPEPKDMTVFVDTKDGSRRFFVVDTQAQTAEYIAAFNRKSSDEISATTFPPVVVKTIPEAGTKNVPPGEFEIKIMFSKKMRDHSWSWSDAWKDSTPEFVGSPKYDSSQKTCSVKVKLEPNKTYGFWINSQNFHNFKDEQGHPAVPYLLVFQTKAESDEKTAVSAAQSWLALIDADNYSASWKNASSIFQSAVTEQSWDDSLNTVRKPLGDLLSRQLISAQHVTELPGAPDGQFVVMQFETSFGNKKTAFETVTFMLEKNGQWKSAGYFIK